MLKFLQLCKTSNLETIKNYLDKLNDVSTSSDSLTNESTNSESTSSELLNEHSSSFELLNDNTYNLDHQNDESTSLDLSITESSSSESSSSESSNGQLIGSESLNDNSHNLDQLINESTSSESTSSASTNSESTNSELVTNDELNLSNSTLINFSNEISASIINSLVQMNFAASLGVVIQMNLLDDQIKLNFNLMNLGTLNPFDFYDNYGNALSYALSAIDIHFDLIQYLINNGVDPNHKNYLGRTPMYYYCGTSNLNLSVFEFLFSYGFYLENSEIVKLLENSSLTVEILEFLKQNQIVLPIYSLIIYYKYGENSDIIKYILNECGINIIINNYDILHFLIMYEKVNKNKLANVVNIFLENNYDINKRDITKMNIVELALYYKSLDENYIISLINKYNVDMSSNVYMPILLAACHGSYTQIATFLINKGFDVNIKNHHNNTCLMFACLNNNFTLIQLLLNKGVNINDVDNDGDNAFSYICGCDNSNDVNIWYVKYMIDKGINIHNISKSNDNALVYLCGHHKRNKKININVSALKLLLKLGVKQDLVNTQGYTFFDYLIENETNNNLIINLIDEKLVDINNKELSRVCYKNNYVDIIAKIENELILNKHEPHSQTCIICYDTFVNNDKIIYCSNNHEFHKECMIHWLQSSKDNKCSLCRDNIYPSDCFICDQGLI